eukprot:CAMPEP_0181325002 /NCGR_PEP_ID=MMETSP1101-20121128/20677_1 /TAXON_ID=46948 /ORGANISM="Rhodomonas abbreviata, Strain Caron Lab Isolate" /LENGTH=88 /DNA_ID=CAMNT_0023433249 /DNA_START=65 /DNA_END=331 /DNA_ORIENTATION=+
MHAVMPFCDHVIQVIDLTSDEDELEVSDFDQNVSSNPDRQYENTKLVDAMWQKKEKIFLKQKKKNGLLSTNPCNPLIRRQKPTCMRKV